MPSSSEAVACWTLEQIRWPAGPTCPKCSSMTVYYLRPGAGHRLTSTGATTHRRVWKCGACRRKFSVLTGTPLERTHVPISVWLEAIYLLDSGATVTVGALRQLGVTYQTARRMRWLLATGHLRVFAAPSSVAQEVRRQQRRQVADPLDRAVGLDRYPQWEPTANEWDDPTAEAAVG